MSACRLRITKGSDGSVILSDTNTTVVDIGLRDGSTIAVKDLGPQIDWRTVFVIEYLGPIIIHLLIYFLRPQIYSLPPFSLTEIPEASELQELSLKMIVTHFIKRELETLFIHRFSLATMPFFNLFKNSGHYWLLSGVLIAYVTYSPTSPTQTNFVGSPLSYLGIVLFIFGEAANFYTHLVLRDLRRAGSTERGIPTGFGFDWVTCPNYLFETIAWLGILAVNRSWSTAVFIIVAVAQMASWAQKKERRYRKEFPDKYKKKRYSMLPGII